MLLLHFNELKNESRMRTIERIADFLELHPVSDQLLGEVYRKSSYEVQYYPEAPRAHHQHSQLAFDLDDTSNVATDVGS